ncbi:hypothetical protein ENHY17A_50407 [Moraxellaceae bacterium 17A]|nr:hypothetical protein ENHY17A_50407 [Moraxellaceae bacterium 17A]
MNSLTNYSLPALNQEVQPVIPLVNVFNAVIDGINQLAVNARDLHKFLKVGRDFTTWIKGRISQYVFVENVDYIIVENLSSPNRGSAKSRCQKMTDYHLALDMAKELSMVENNEEGRKIRRYFIRCEKDLYKSDSKQREVLRQVCSKLSHHYGLIGDIYLMVGKHFGYESGIKDIPTSLLPEATAFVYEMLLSKQESNVSLQKAIVDPVLIQDIQYLVAQNFITRSWVKAIREPLNMLNPRLVSEIYGTTGWSAEVAKSINKSLNLEVDTELLNRNWQQKFLNNC